MLPRRHIVSFLKSLVIAYAIICALMFTLQRHLLYLPEREVQSPSSYDLHGFEDISLTAADGIQLQAWYHKANPGFPTLVYFHGNGGHLGYRANYFRLLSKAGFGILGLSYRGYGTSEGNPSEQGFYLDARAAMNYAAHTLKLKPQQIIIYGESIGTGVAVQMATEYKSAALILQSPYTSITDVASDTYPWLPISLLLRDRFDSLSKIEHIHTPLLLFHGEKDTIISIRFARTLFDHAPMPKTSIYVPEVNHNDFDLAFLTRTLVAFAKKNAIIH